MENFIAVFLSLYLLVTPLVVGDYQVDRVIDGDTIEVSNLAGDSKRIRFACIDSPESSQSQGAESKELLSAFLPVGTEVSLKEVDRDRRYGRSVSIVYKDGKDINLAMLTSGQAVVYNEYLYNCKDETQSYLDAEAIAKKNRIGVWGDPLFVTPSEYRRRNRKTVRPKAIDKEFVPGTCSELREAGLFRFSPDSPNYTLKRDRDRDAIACE